MKKILILGGGFAGIYTAKNLQKQNLDDFQIELISDNNYFIFQPLLPEVASGTIYSSDAVTPIRQMLKGIKYRNAEISGIACSLLIITVPLKRVFARFMQGAYLVLCISQSSDEKIDWDCKFANDFGCYFYPYCDGG